ncbi:MAG: sugar transferase [Bacteroidia bacterium]
MSKAEALGRLVSCGFEIVDYRSINGLMYFVVKKIKQPEFNMNPSYGPLYKMPRVGKDGKMIGVYKIRTMYSYAEYLQKYIYDKHGTKDGDKANEDYRVTSFGKIIRKFWLDELPTFINLFKGEIKLVGVRPLSVHKFNMYPKYAQERRCKFKPGLIPPFYYDRPNNFDELVASEMKYFDAYEKKPFRTDMRYFFVAIYNIIFKGARSK